MLMFLRALLEALVLIAVLSVTYVLLYVLAA